MAALPDSKQNGQGSANENIDLTEYEKDGTLVDLAENDIYNDLRDLLKDKPYELTNGPAIRVARALIKKHKRGT